MLASTFVGVIALEVSGSGASPRIAIALAVKSRADRDVDSAEAIVR